MHNRIRQLREHLKLSQTAFAEKVGMTRSMISNMELGLVDIPEYRIKTIVKEFNVNRHWLETGEGEMFLPQPQDDQALVDRLVRAYHGSPVLRNILTAYLQLDEPHRRVADEVLESFAAAVQSARDEHAPEPDVDAWLAQVTLDPPPDAKAQ